MSAANRGLTNAGRRKRARDDEDELLSSVLASSRELITLHTEKVLILDSTCVITSCTATR